MITVHCTKVAILKNDFVSNKMVFHQLKSAVYNIIYIKLLCNGASMKKNVIKNMNFTGISHWMCPSGYL